MERVQFHRQWEPSESATSMALNDLGWTREQDPHQNSPNFNRLFSRFVVVGARLVVCSGGSPSNPSSRESSRVSSVASARTGPPTTPTPTTTLSPSLPTVHPGLQLRLHTRYSAALDPAEASSAEDLAAFCVGGELLSISARPHPTKCHSFALTGPDGALKSCVVLAISAPLPAHPLLPAPHTKTDIIPCSAEGNLPPAALMPRRFTSPPEASLAWYAPVYVCLVCKLPLFRTMRRVLGRVADLAFQHYGSAISTSVVEGFVPLEHHIWHLLLNTPVPPRGGPRIFFSVADHWISVKRPPYQVFPALELSLRKVFEAIDVRILMQIFAAIVTEQKCLVVSKSMSLLHEVCETVIAVMFPLRFQSVYIPVFPHTLMDFYDVISAPCPYLIGVRADEIDPIWCEMTDAVIFDLDHCLIRSRIEDSAFELPQQPSFALLERLRIVMHPEILLLDSIEDIEPGRPSDAEINVGIRAAFLEFWGSVLSSYRDNMFLMRVFPKPVVVFRNSFMAKELYGESIFMDRLLTSQHFALFLQEHAVPFSNIFDNSLRAVRIGQSPTVFDFAVNLYRRADGVIVDDFDGCHACPEGPPLPSLLGSEEEDGKEDHFVVPRVKAVAWSERTREAYLHEQHEAHPGDFPPLTAEIRIDADPLINRVKQRPCEVISSDTLFDVFDAHIPENSVITSVLETIFSDFDIFITADSEPIYDDIFKDELARCYFATRMRHYSKMDLVSEDHFDCLVKLCTMSLRNSSEAFNYRSTVLLLPTLFTFYCKRTEARQESLSENVKEHLVWQQPDLWMAMLYILLKHMRPKELHGQRSIAEHVLEYHTKMTAVEQQATQKQESELILNCLVLVAHQMNMLDLPREQIRSFLYRTCTKLDLHESMVTHILSKLSKSKSSSCGNDEPTADRESLPAPSPVRSSRLTFSGILCVTVVRGSLAQSAKKRSKPSTYCTLTLNGQKAVMRSRRINHSLEPAWNWTFTTQVERISSIEIGVIQDNIITDTNLGKNTLLLENFSVGTEHSIWLPLLPGKEHKVLVNLLLTSEFE